MKKTLLIMVMALAVLLTQCRKPEVKFPSPVAPEGTTVSMTVTAGPGSKTDITHAGGITWSTGDKLYVGDGSKYIGYLTITSGEGTPTGTFSGDVTLTGITEGTEKTFGFYYLGSAERTLTVGATTADVDFSSQEIYADNGKLKNASKHHVGYGSASGTVKDGIVTGINVTLVSKVALARFSFTDGTTSYSGALTLSGVSNKMTVKFNGAGFSYEVSGDVISLTNTSASEKYVMLVPTGGTGDVALSFAGGGKTGGATIEGGIQSNKFYGKTGAIAVSLTAPTTAHETVNFGNPNLNWSKYNLGVDPENLDDPWDWYGDYYAWGEVVPYYTSLKWTSATTCTVDGWNTEATLGCGGHVDASKGYAFQSYSHGSSLGVEWNESPCTGSVPYDSDGRLKPARDAATQAWGEGWRMPTTEEWQALYDNNTFEWLAAGDPSQEVTSFTAVAAGYLVIKGKESSLDPTVSMFLPAAGRIMGLTFIPPVTEGRYWAAEYIDRNDATSLMWNEDWGFCTCWDSNRCFGCTVRPVR